MCRREMSRMWVGARGAMSRIARTSSSSYSRVAGSSLATIPQNRQGGGHQGSFAPQNEGFVLMRKPMTPTSAAIRYDT